MTEIVEAHRPTSPELTDFKPTAQINLDDFEGRDLRTLSDEEIEKIDEAYPLLRQTTNGYRLGQAVKGLASLRNKERRTGKKDKLLNDDELWIFESKKKEK